MFKLFTFLDLAISYSIIKFSYSISKDVGLNQFNFLENSLMKIIYWLWLSLVDMTVEVTPQKNNPKVSQEIKLTIQLHSVFQSSKEPYILTIIRSCSNLLKSCIIKTISYNYSYSWHNFMSQHIFIFQWI